MDYNSYLQKRKTILKDVDKCSVYNNRSENVNNIRVCALCGRMLTAYVPRSNSYVAIYKHYHYSYWHGQLVGNLCYNPKTCYKRIVDKR